VYPPVYPLFGPGKMTRKPANLRSAMPLVTAWIDDLRAVFGTEDINGIIKAGVEGLPGFHASENGHTVGTPLPAGGREISLDRLVIETTQAKVSNVRR
jgi:hypothetical protein